MKFIELKNKINVFNLDHNNSSKLYIKITDSETIIGNGSGILYCISNLRVGYFKDFTGSKYLSRSRRLALQKLAYKYSRTPLDERRDEPKLRVRILPDEVNGYLNQSTDKNLFVADGEDWPRCKTIYTQSEYEQLQQKYPEWLPEFDENDPHFEFLEDEK